MGKLTISDDICDVNMEGLNDFILKLTAYQKIYPEHGSIATEVCQRLEQIITNGEKLGKLKMIECSKTFANNEARIRELRGARKNETDKIDKAIQAKYDKKVQEVSRKLLLSGNSDDKDQDEVERRALMDAVDKEITTDKLKASKEVLEKYRPHHELIEQENLESFKGTAKTLISFKMMEMTLKVSYARCKAVLAGLIELVEKCGR